MFQSLSGLSLGLNQESSSLSDGDKIVSIPFRAVTGFEHEDKFISIFEEIGFNPFQGCHWV